MWFVKSLIVIALSVLGAVMYAYYVKPKYRHELHCTAGTMLAAYAIDDKSKWVLKDGVWRWGVDIAYTKNPGEKCTIKIVPLGDN